MVWCYSHSPLHFQPSDVLLQFFVFKLSSKILVLLDDILLQSTLYIGKGKSHLWLVVKVLTRPVPKLSAGP